MHIAIEIFTVDKRFALTISRGTTSQTKNVWVRVSHDGIEGWGEASPFSIGEQGQSTDKIIEALQRVAPQLKKFSPLDRQEIEEILTQTQLRSAARAALDMALHDWLGKRVGLPLWQLWGLDRTRIVPISVTIGISTPEVARQRVQDWLQVVKAQFFKVKLGSPEGIEADRAMLKAIREDVPDAEMSVDANGGWNVQQALAMCDWLAEYNIKYVEQPLPRGQEVKLPELKERSPIPIFVDESCFTSRDIPKLADRAHGINIKLMKSGGLTEAMRMVHTARACGLQVMFGCYSDSSLSNTAAVQLSSLADYLDLDSHLNLSNDPFQGAILQEGVLLPNDLPGLGVKKV